MVHGFHRLSDFWSGPKVTKKPPEPTASGPPFIHPGFVNVAAILGIVTGNYMRLSGAGPRGLKTSRVLHPCKEAALFGFRASNIGEEYWLKMHVSS